MNTLARALIDLSMYLEHWEGPIVDDDVVKMLESVAGFLQEATTEEVTVLRATLAALIEEERAGAARSGVLRYYSTFMDSFGLDVDGRDSAV